MEGGLVRRRSRPSASRTVAVSSSSPTASEARAAQSRAAAISGGGSLSRVAGLNAQANSACRSTFGPAVAGGRGRRPCCRTAGRAGLPPGTAGIHPPLRPPRQVARRGAGLDTRPAATRRYERVPAPPRGGDGPGDGPAPGRVPRRGHGGAHREGAHHRRTCARGRPAARYGRACPLAARYAG